MAIVGQFWHRKGYIFRGLKEGWDLKFGSNWVRMKWLLWCMVLPSTVASISPDQLASDKSTVVTECSLARKVSRCVIPSPIKTELTTQKSRSVLHLSGPWPGASISSPGHVLVGATRAGVICPASLISDSAGPYMSKDRSLESTPKSGAAAASRLESTVNVRLFAVGVTSLSTKRVQVMVEKERRISQVASADNYCVGTIEPNHPARTSFRRIRCWIRWRWYLRMIISLKLVIYLWSVSGC